MKMFAVVRADLEPGAKAIQASHALRAFQARYPELEAVWWKDSNTLVLLETPQGLQQLLELEQRATAEGVPCERFVEPDWDPEGTLTALVLGPSGKRLVRSLPLAFGSCDA